jgi:putative DNA-invertase from lambdoid prophage Rac
MKVAIYARVSTDDQNAERQVLDLTAFAERCGHEVVEVFRETASGTKNDRKQREKVRQLAKGRFIQAVMVTELSRWGRNTEDLLRTVQELADWGVSLLALKGQDFDLTTATGKLMLTMLSAISDFERGLLSERTKSGLAAARAKGKTLGRPTGNKAIAKHTEAVTTLLGAGKSYRDIAEQLHISKNTAMKIAQQLKA